MAHTLASLLRGGALLLFLAVIQSSHAQNTGSIVGKITDQKSGDPLSFVNVIIKGTNIGASTNDEGRYEITNLQPGTYAIVVTLIGYETQNLAGIEVRQGQSVVRDVSLVDRSVLFGDITVFGASRRAERITEAPSAISSISPKDIVLNANHGQLPRLLEMEPGVDIVQSGVQDFNINTRGFNSSLNRRLLVLLDGRDLAIAFLGAQEWNGLSMPLEDISRLELVRGPGSALYGPNAFNGVINITTPSPSEVKGTKVSYSYGDLTMHRLDARHAGIAGGGWSYKANIGRVQSGTWSRSRVIPPFEYSGLAPEAIPLSDGDVSSSYMSGRVDYDYVQGHVATVEGGLTEVENELFITGIGRVQVLKAHKPWTRLNWASDRVNAMFWWQGRKSIKPQVSLASGAPLIEKSNIFNGEVQYNFDALDDQLKVIVGASHRLYKVDTEGTLMEEKRNDNTSGLSGQIEYTPLEYLKIVGAARWDWSTLHKSQFSPKAGVVWTPIVNHSIRGTFNQAFQVPNYSEFFLRANAAAPTASPAQLEGGLEAYFAAVRGSLPPSLVDPLNLPTNIPWNFSNQTQVLALGNKDLRVEKITGFEIGYKGVLLENKLFVTFDLYHNKLKDFITDLLPGVNANYPRFGLTDGGVDVPKNLNDLEALYNGLGLPDAHPLRQNLAALRAGYGALSTSALIPLLATLPSGQRAGVISYTNAGKVDETGTELGVNFYLTDELLLSGNWTWYDFKVKEQQRGDVLLPNAPKHKFAASTTYRHKDGYEVSLGMRNVQAFRWAAGIFEGQIPAYTLVNVGAGYQISPNYRIGLTVSNLFDHRVYQLFGGSLIGRQAIGTVTATF